MTYGLSEIFGKETSEPSVSGYGIELTFRLRRSGESAPPHWPMQMLTAAADYVYETGNAIKPLHVLVLPGRISLGPCKDLEFLFFVSDPALPPVQSVNGRVAFVQGVGITADEEDLIARWDARKVQAALAEGNPLLMTDPGRTSLLSDPLRRAQLRTQAAAEGSMRELEFLPGLVVEAEAGMNRSVLLRVDDACSRVLARALQSRVALHRDIRVKARAVVLHLVAAADGYEPWTAVTTEEVTLGVPPARVADLVALLEFPGGTHTPRWFPELTIAHAGPR